MKIQTIKMFAWIEALKRNHGHQKFVHISKNELYESLPLYIHSNLSLTLEIERFDYRQ